MSKKQINQVTVPLLTLLLLCGVAMETASRPSPDDAAPYHAKVRWAVDAIPYRLGNWVGVEVPIPPSARAMLRPNALFSRKYENLATGRQVALIIVQCQTARDLRGHYPPICYPAHGWQKVNDGLPVDWQVGEQTIQGTEYHFTMSTSDRAPHKVVANFMILPDGRVVRDMKAVDVAASDYLRHFFGAAQIQVVMHSHIPADERQGIVEELIGAIAPVVDVIRSGDAT